ncbi:OmpA family protein [Flavobacterium branchiarum]|uniref:OmpA family protein n=1 Tax=Flavobacterium branchiarum TaxID=1114870 RepID=A0ABV5FQM0_9FLAO|nr:OmpA family protein [Flavobacterium branchiarum]MDN3673001.1 OmpA family protein [Flavobacterium branchiarum]
MYRYRKCYVALLIVISTLGVTAQDRKPEIKVANEYFDRNQYKQASLIYEKLAQKKNVKTVLLEKLAYSYKEMNDYDKASQWYQVITQRNDASKDFFLFYGDILKNQGNYSKAKEVYMQYKQIDSKDISARIMGCDSAMVWLKKTSSNKIANLQKVNTSASEWGPTMYNGKSIVFASDSLRNSLFGREINKKVKYGWTGRPYIKLYQYTPNDSNTSDVIQFSKELNQFKYHVGPITFSSDYTIAYFTVTNQEKIVHKKDPNSNFYGARRLEIYSSTLINGIWQEPVAFAYNNVEAYSVGHPALSKDGNTLYFSSDMPGGSGKTDLWYSEKNSDGSWGNPINCGTTINTSEEDQFPTIAENNQLYFASKGHPGMGGFDIFSTTGQKNQWTKPLNLRNPINSPADDFFLTMLDPSNGYFSSNRKEGMGNDDIYSCTIVPEKIVPEKITPEPLIVDRQPQQKDNTTPKTGEKFILYYYFDKANIRKDASQVLDSVATLLKQYPEMKIKFSSYTDSRGPKNYNLVLSQKRAQSAMAYLQKKGIAKNRMSAKGYGETHLVNHCGNGVKCSEEEHQKNRRTEVVIISL